MRLVVLGALRDGSSPGHLRLKGLRCVATLGFRAAGVPGGFGSCMVGEIRNPASLRHARPPALQQLFSPDEATLLCV